MKIGLAQSRPWKGDIEQNIQNHKRIIGLAVDYDTEMIIFPELSLTGYEPELAERLATTNDDPRFDDFQKLSDSHQITICVGMPLKSTNGIVIAMIIFQPEEERRVYDKIYLHADEEPYFVSGSHLPDLYGNHKNISLAICYELSVPSHSEKAHELGANIYIASVAKFKNGVEKAITQLSNIAKKYSMTVLMANAVGEADGDICAGQSSIWNIQGELLGQLDDTEEGILVFDTNSQEVIEIDKLP